MARPAKPSAGVIGLGIIGSRVAANLRKAGYQVWVWNRSPKPEPNFLSSPLEVAESTKIIQIYVADGPALLEIVTAMAPALGPEHVILNHATVSPKETIEAAGIVQERHAKYLDAPFTGSRDVASAGQIVYFIGGDVQALEKSRAQLSVSAKEILPIGDIGQAAAMKIATNLIAAVSVAAYAEALGLLQKSGIPLYKLGEVFQHHGVRSPLADMKVPGMITGDFEPRFSLKHMFKDVQIALAMAEEHGIDLPEASAYAGYAMAGIHKGWSDLDFSSIAQLFDYPNPENEIPDGLFGSSSTPGASEQAKAAEKKSGKWLFGGKK